MKEFYRNIIGEKPRVFSMSASPFEFAINIKNIQKNEEVIFDACKKKIIEYEEILDSKLISASNKSEIEEVVAKPDFNYIFFPSDSNIKFQFLENIIKKYETKQEVEFDLKD